MSTTLSQADAYVLCQHASPPVVLDQAQLDELMPFLVLVYELGAARRKKTDDTHLASVEHELAACKAGQLRLTEWLAELSRESEKHKEGPPCPPSNG